MKSGVQCKPPWCVLFHNLLRGLEQARLLACTGTLISCEILLDMIQTHEVKVLRYHIPNVLI